jgi:transcriptional regulator with XRE-family HTH domain
VLQCGRNRGGAILSFSGWLRANMHEYRLNQPRLAEVLGVGQSTISNWLRDKTVPDVDKVTALAEVFHADRVALLGMIGVDTGQPYEFKVLGPLVEEIDRMLAMVEDAEDRALIEERLKHDVRAARDMLEALNQRRHK